MYTIKWETKFHFIKLRSLLKKKNSSSVNTNFRLAWINQKNPQTCIGINVSLIRNNFYHFGYFELKSIIKKYFSSFREEYIRCIYYFTYENHLYFFSSFRPKDIFKADETAFFFIFFVLLKKILNFKRKTSVAGKINNEKIIALVCANSAKSLNYQWMESPSIHGVLT